MSECTPRVLALYGGIVLFGQERANIEVLATLKARGCDVLCLIRDDDWNRDVPCALEARGLSYLRVPYIDKPTHGRLAHTLLRNPLVFARANFRLWHIAHEFKATHIYAFNSMHVLNFLVCIALLRASLIYRAGDSPTRHNTFFRLLWSFIVRRANHFVAVSRFIQRQLKMTGVADQRISVIYGQPPTRVDVRPLPETPSLVDTNLIRIVYIGQITPEKGVDVLLEAFRLVAPESPRTVLLIAGRLSTWIGDAWALDLAAKVADDAILHDRVSFLGLVDDVYGLLRRSQIHVCPSVWDEPFGNVVMEAKLEGVPSIVFPSGGLPELIRHEVDGLVCQSKTARALAEALRRYIRDPYAVRKHGAAARASVNETMGCFADSWMRVVNRASP